MPRNGDGSPQLEDGYCRIANEIMEALAKIRIPGQASQLLWWILRNTYGWNRKSITAQTSVIARNLSVSPQTVCKMRDTLVAMNIVTQKGNDSGVTYCINKKYDSWKPLPKKVTIKSVTQLGYDRNPKRKRSLPKKVTPHIKTYINTKDTSSPTGEHAQIVKYFCDKHQDKFHFKYPFDGGKDGELVKQLLKRWKTAANVYILIDALFDSTDHFFDDKKTIPMLRSMDSRLAQAAANRLRPHQPDHEFLKYVRGEK